MGKMLYLLGCLLLIAQAQATTLPYKNFNDLVREANGIVEGTVEDITARRTDQGDIYTYITLSNLQLHKGSYDGDRLTLVQEGGLVEGRGIHVHGSPSFREGERVIAFVEGNGQRIVPLVGWEQGLFRVVTIPETGERLIADSAGNRVFGIENGRIVKEARVSTEAEILGDTPAGFRESREPGFSPGRQDNAGTVNQSSSMQGESPRQPAPAGRAMPLDRFVEQVQQAVSRIGAQADTQPLTSVEIGQVPQFAEQGAGRGAEQADAPPPRTDAQPGALQSAPDERGERPMRLQTGPENSQDVQ